MPNDRTVANAALRGAAQGGTKRRSAVNLPYDPSKGPPVFENLPYDPSKGSPTARNLASQVAAKRKKPRSMS
jgi:hypothetical protein